MLSSAWGYIANGVVVFPGSITKSGKTREVDIHPRLSCALDHWRTEWSDYRLNGKPIHERVDIAPGALPGADHFLFPGLGFATHMKRQSYDRVLRRTLQELAIKGASHIQCAEARLPSWLMPEHHCATSWKSQVTKVWMSCRAISAARQSREGLPSMPYEWAVT